MSEQKILISGCGLSWSGQERRVWTNILKVAGADIVDVGGPAVSNQWILDQAFLTLLENPNITNAVVQLTNLGKLDVEIDATRELSLVKSDSIRNFIHKGIWPSSASQEHLSKKLWYKYLYSPKLEQQEIFCKILLLDNWCATHNVKLTILQGYQITWTDRQLVHLTDKIYNLDSSIWKKYQDSPFYEELDEKNTVPGLDFQFELVKELTKLVAPALLEKINYISTQYDQSRNS